MRVKITKPGIYTSEGKEIEVGTELDVKNEPTVWAGRYEVLSGDGKGKTAVTNPKDGALPGDEAPAGPFTVTDGGNGWWSILDAKGEKVGKGLREDDAKAFSELSPSDQAEFAAEHAKS
ncbi:hypothetical protein [Brevundimonas nasdae]|uniref:hypothetical protein n=1 Tax=Brevundimonas nasdae TaxID=172043 RepID=UPI00338B2358